MNEVLEQEKLKCINHHTFFRYDSRGIHLWCRHCKTIRELPWEELQQMHQQAQGTSTSERPVLY